VALAVAAGCGASDISTGRAVRTGLGSALVAGGVVSLGFLSSACSPTEREYRPECSRSGSSGLSDTDGAALLGAGIGAMIAGLLVMGADVPDDGSEPSTDAATEGSDTDRAQADGCEGAWTQYIRLHAGERLERGGPTIIRADVNPVQEGLRVWLYYRPAGADGFRALPMEGSDCRHVVVLPCAVPEPESWEFFIGVTSQDGTPLVYLDETGSRSVGAPLGPPLRVRLVEPDAPTSDDGSENACDPAIGWDFRPFDASAPPLEKFDRE
jgi:hypothetical protein